MIKETKVERMECPACGHRICDKEEGASGPVRQKCIKCKSCIKICPLNKNYEQIESQEISVLRLKDEKKIISYV